MGGNEVSAKEKINHPSHYNMGGIEVIDAIESWGLGEGFNRGNAIKYIARAGRKDPDTEIEDLRKAEWYIDREMKRLGGAGDRFTASDVCFILGKYGRNDPRFEAWETIKYSPSEVQKILEQEARNDRSEDE